MDQTAQCTAAEWGTRDGLRAWLDSVAWTSDDGSEGIPFEYVPAVARLVGAKLDAIAQALAIRERELVATIRELHQVEDGLLAAVQVALDTVKGWDNGEWSTGPRGTAAMRALHGAVAAVTVTD